MSDKDSLYKIITEGYNPKGDSIIMGAAMLNGETLTGAHVKIPLKTMNRHGLIAGATGTGKTKTLQIIAEQLSQKGIPSLLMDIKGDLSGIAAASDGHPKIDERHEKIGLEYVSHNSPVEIMTISDQEGIRMRATVSEFGPVLLSRILDVTETQAGIISVVFKYCDDNKLPLLDLDDLKRYCNMLQEQGKKSFKRNMGVYQPLQLERF
ncbi:hypothetical protein JCM19297_1473 [Nonlabens ulvanivorans]|nr:hypothetical protein JCM19297_1473 [Nonlabens ulvanivorans]